uniref:Uncharacterized protein n=1 Tax=Tanacetum cinerariifolium TaxID=118510 RepID=A0A699K2G8_TANCI|nr:hypothetical protein [Tanacetum cinerariifolium]
MFDCDDYLTFESDESLPPSPISDRYHSGDGYHAVPPPYTETFMPPKSNSVFYNAPNNVETVHTAFNVDLSPTKPAKDLLVTTDVPKTSVTRPRQAKTVVTKTNLPPRRHINRRPSPKASTFPLKFTVVKAPMLNGGYVAFGGNPKGGKISGKGKIRTGKLDFDDVYFVKELKLPDEHQMMLRVPRENNMYNVDLKNIVPS